MATNRIETLDPALLRPGRVDRKIEFPLPDQKTKRRIFGIHTGRMTLSDDVSLEEFVMSKVRGGEGGGGQAGKGPACFSPTRTPCRLTLDGGAPLPPARPQDELSGADIKAMCTEAGLLALRERRMKVTQVDFRKAKEKVMYKKKEGVPEGLYM